MQGETSDFVRGLERFGRILWRAAWAVQFFFWLVPVAFFAFHYLVEAPRFEETRLQTLETGFNGMAGIIAAAAPEWDVMRDIRGHGFIFLLDVFIDRGMAFDVWLDLDEKKAWHAGAAVVQYKADKRLDWVKTSWGKLHADNLRPASPAREQGGRENVMAPAMDYSTKPAENAGGLETSSGELEGGR